MEPVKNKREFMRRYLAGEFGNHSPSWTDVDEFLAYGRGTPSNSPVPGIYHLRNGTNPGVVTHYNLSWSATVARWCEQPDKRGWFASTMVPADVERTLRLQGEVMRDVGGLYLYYSTLAQPMRWALRERGCSARGLTAELLLRDALDPADWDWLQELLENYSGHVVEFGGYGRRWGTLWRRMVVWEVRAY